MIRFRADMDIKQYFHDEAKLDVAIKYMNSTEAYLRQLIDSPLINDDERAGLTTAAGLPSDDE